MADQIMRRTSPLPYEHPPRKVHIKLDQLTRQWVANHGIYYALGTTPVRAVQHLKHFVAKENNRANAN